MKLVALLCSVLASSALRASTNDWPVYRHDVALSGVSPGKGKIVKPEIKWEYYLGAPPIEIAMDRELNDLNVADLDGDGTPERFSLKDKTIEVSDLSGKRLWSSTVDGAPLGGNLRVGKLLPDRKGQQIISFSHRMDTGEGQGYCFAFDKGVTNGELTWTTGPLTAQYSPTLIVDDLDGDGLPEIVTAPHYDVQIYNGQTGALKAAVRVAKGRNYGILLSRPRPGRREKDIFVISDFVLHVECVRFENGKWIHAWGKKYLEDENAPRPQGREQYIRVGPNPVTDLDGDGHDELAYMLVDATKGDQWHLLVHDCETGTVKADIAGIWLWSVVDLDGDGVAEILYTATPEKRPATWCDLRVGHLRNGQIADVAILRNVRPVPMNATLPPTAHTIADEGLNDILRSDTDGDGLPEFFVGEESKPGRFDDAFAALSLQRNGKLKQVWRFAQRGHRLNLISASANGVRVQDLTAGKVLTVDAKAKITNATALGKPGGFTTKPIVVDLDGDGRNEIIVQNAVGKILALAVPTNNSASPKVLWSHPGVAMNASPGYSMAGGLSPQAADVDGDGRPEVLFAAEDDRGRSSLVCADGRGKLKWRRSIEGCPWGGLQAGVDHWTFGRFTGRPRGLDVFVDLHRRSKGSGEGWLLRGDTGEVVWQRKGIAAKETAMPFGGGIPAVADVNGDGVDDLVQMFFTVYGVTSGRTGDPIFPPAFLTGANYFDHWLAYSEPTVADLDGDGQLDVYLNSRSYARGGYAAVHADGKPLWAEFHNNDEGSNGLGPVGDFDGDGTLEIAVPVLDGTLLCLNAKDGSHKWRIESRVQGDIVAADVNGDGIMELLFAGAHGQLRAVSGKDGHEVWSIPAGGSPIIADTDGDGLLEVLAVGNDGVLRVIGDAQPADDGFTAIFNGHSLAGWETPDTSYWTVEDGSITARITKEHPCTVNQYLVWQGGELADFELKLKSRVNGEGRINNGFQFRSRLLPDHDVCGYQMDNNLQTPWLARLYDEYGRHTLAWRGERAVFDADGNRTVTKITEAEGAAWFRLEDWHEYHLTCVGSRITLRIDGRLAAEVEDNDPRRRELQGILALQLHSGPPTVAQFKDIRLKVIKPAAPRQKPSLSRNEKKREALRREAVAWWPLATGGHGAQPPLRHIPGWEKFELNVHALGPGTRAGTDVVILDGAYFDAGMDLQGGEEAVTVYLRARDPSGQWNSALFAKRGSHELVHFNLFSADLPETPGADIGFEIRTERGFVMVSFPVSQIEATAWHDLVGRYDGKHLEIFCDGKRMAGKAWSGRLLKNQEPLLIGAETDSGKVVRHFRGELEVAALWSRALRDDEVTLLNAK